MAGEKGRAVTLLSTDDQHAHLGGEHLDGRGLGVVACRGHASTFSSLWATTPPLTVSVPCILGRRVARSAGERQHPGDAHRSGPAHAHQQRSPAALLRNGSEGDAIGLMLVNEPRPSSKAVIAHLLS
jgi:hypothetical protein